MGTRYITEALWGNHLFIFAYMPYLRIVPPRNLDLAWSNQWNPHSPLSRAKSKMEISSASRSKSPKQMFASLRHRGYTQIRCSSTTSCRIGWIYCSSPSSMSYAVRCGQKINPNYWPNYWPLCCLVYRVILKSINWLFYAGQLPQLDPNCWSFRLLPHNITFTYYFCLRAQIPEFVLPHHLDTLDAYKCVKSPNSSVPHSGPVIAGFICIPIIGE